MGRGEHGPRYAPVSADDQDKPTKSHRQVISEFLPYLWPKDRLILRSRVVTAMVCLIASKVANVYVPMVYKGIIDHLSGGTGETDLGDLEVPLTLILTYGILRLATRAFADARDAIFLPVTNNAMRAISLRTFQHLHSLSLSFHLKRKTGGILRAIERGTSGVSFLLSFVLFSIGPLVAEILMVCVILLILYEPAFCAAIFTTIVGYIVFTLVITEWRTKFRRIMNEKDNDSNNAAVDSLLNYETVKFFGNEDHEYRRYATAMDEYFKASMDARNSLALLNVGQAAIIGVGMTFVMYLSAKRIVSGTMTIGDLVLVNTYLMQLYTPLNFLGSSYRMIKQALVNLEQMFSLLDEPLDIEDTPNAVPLRASRAQASIEFRDVEFEYVPDQPVLSGVSFTVPSGTTTAVVGSSGAGKSTLARLLYRFYEVSSGSILVGGQPLNEVTQASLRAAIAIVPQDTVLFNETLEYNLRYGRPDATPAEVIEAAKLARIHEFAMSQPEEYDTRVGERGLRLSGGEKQRVSIARAILKDPAIMVFDEATSALDSHTERDIQASLRAVAKGRTTLVVAHRLSTIAEADQIIVLDSGKIAERGSHSELLAANGLYAAMWAAQQEESMQQSDQSPEAQPSHNPSTPSLSQQAS